MTTVFNLIILDESGSMMGVTDQTISGCNETLNVVRSSAEKFANTQRHLVSVYAFQSGGKVPSRYLVKNATPDKVDNITTKDYSPWGGTPLLDAVGSCLAELKTVSSTHEDATGVITIITDGYENSSTQYTWEKVRQLISWFREMGWTVNLVGANIDVEKMGDHMGINRANTQSFMQDEEGTKEMFTRLGNAQKSRYESYNVEANNMSIEARIQKRKTESEDFWN